MKNPPADTPEQQASGPSSRALPPRLSLASLSPAAALLRKQERERKDALVRGVTSIEAMRAAIRQAAHELPEICAVPRLGRFSVTAFHARAAQGLPFIVSGLVGRWPLSGLTPEILCQRFG